MRFTFVIPILMCACVTAAAQDMPLSQVLIDGEGWVMSTGESPKFESKTPTHIPDVVEPTCQVKSPDGGTMFVGSAKGKYIWAFRVAKDGTLDAGQPYCSLFVPRGQQDLPVWAMTVDTAGRVYAATPLGVQIFDPTGRLCGVLSSPTKEPVRNIALAGSSGNTLYLVGVTTTFLRHVKSQGLGYAKPK